MLNPPINIRLTPEKQLLLEDEAAQAGKPLSTYLRERLEAEGDTCARLSSLQMDLASLRHLVEDLGETGIEGGGSGMAAGDRAMMTEALLLLRYPCKPEQLREVRADMRRYGVEVWNPEVVNG